MNSLFFIALLCVFNSFIHASSDPEIAAFYSEHTIPKLKRDKETATMRIYLQQLPKIESQRYADPNFATKCFINGKYPSPLFNSELQEIGDALENKKINEEQAGLLLYCDKMRANLFKALEASNLNNQTPKN